MGHLAGGEGVHIESKVQGGCCADGQEIQWGTYRDRLGSPIAQQPKCPIQKGLTLKTEKPRGCSVIPTWHLPWGGGTCSWHGPETRSFASLQCAGTGPNPRSLSVAALDWPLYVLIRFGRGSMLGASPGGGAFPRAQGPLQLLSPCCSVHRFRRC